MQEKANKGNCIMRGEQVSQKDTIVNLYVPNLRVPRFHKRSSICSNQRGTCQYNNNDFNIKLLTMDVLNRLKINKETPELKYTIVQGHSISFYRTFHLTAANEVFGSVCKNSFFGKG